MFLFHICVFFSVRFSGLCESAQDKMALRVNDSPATWQCSTLCSSHLFTMGQSLFVLSNQWSWKDFHIRVQKGRRIRGVAIKIFVTFFSMWTRTYGIRTTYMWQDIFFCILKIWTNKIWPCSEITCKSVCIVLKLLWNWKACPVSHLASLVLALAPPAVQKLTFAF